MVGGRAGDKPIRLSDGLEEDVKKAANGIAVEAAI
jgi:hypothetical protein